MSFCDVPPEEVFRGERSIILPSGKIDGFCNIDNAPLENFTIHATLASSNATQVNAAEEAAKIRERTQARRAQKRQKMHDFRVKLAKRAAALQRSLNESRDEFDVPKLPHTELSKLVVRGSHIDAEPVDVSYLPAHDAESSHAGAFQHAPAQGGGVALTREEAELQRLSALTPVLLDRQRIQVALESQRARAALASYGQRQVPNLLPPPPVPQPQPALAPRGNEGGAQPPPPPHTRVVLGDHSGHHESGGAWVRGHGKRGKAHGHGHGHGHENCVPQWNSLPDNWRDIERRKAVKSVVEARRVYMARERRIVRAKVARQQQRRAAARAAALARQQEAEARMQAILQQQAEAEAIAEQAQHQQQVKDEAEQESKRKALKQKRREDDGRRFIAALRQRAMDKIKQRGIALPELCQCTPGASILEPRWETCANNCQFYRNPAAYTRALADLFQALDLVDN